MLPDDPCEPPSGEASRTLPAEHTNAAERSAELGHADPGGRAAASRWRQRLAGALALLAPPRCAGCTVPIGAAAGGDPRSGARATDRRRLPDHLCAPCESALDLAPTSEAAEPVGRSPWPLRAPLPYAGAGEAWVRRIKYPRPGLRGLDAEARGLLFALARDAAQGLPRPDAIVPVPLHGRAYLRREFNPALLFARALARALRAPVHPTLLEKRRATRPQKGLGVAERRANVAGAFEVPPRQRGRFGEDAIVFVVDDVVTTGATLDACIEALRAGGVARAGWAVCIARTPRPSGAVRPPTG